MLIEQYELFSSAQAITAAAASTNVLDLKAIRDLGVGARPIYCRVQVTTAFTDSSSDSTLAVTVDASADNSSWTSSTQTLGTFAALAAVGDYIDVPLAVDGADKRYIRLTYTPANGNLSAGAVTAFLHHDPQAWTAYAKGYTGPTTA